MHSKIGYSATGTFEKCPYQYYLQYVLDIETLPPDDAGNALVMGTAMHKGIETDVETAVSEYFMSYPVISDLHISEAMKLEAMIPKVKDLLAGADGELQYEVEFTVGDFIGTIDLLESTGVGDDGALHFNLYDFKYSNNEDTYMVSRQLHVYKHMYELATGNIIDKLYYIFIPKTMIRQKKTEDIFQFRQRLEQTLAGLDPYIKEVEFEPQRVTDYYDLVEEIENAKEYPKCQSKLCDWCSYQSYCERGENYMLLPSVERRTVNSVTKRKLWIYGGAFSGKTTMLDSAPNPLNLNSDGNIQFVSMPYIKIADVVTVEGRVTKTKFAWDVFKETIGELEKKQNDFKTIIVDLVEDTREMCRIFMYDKLGIQHESDSGYGKGWDIIKTEYLSTMRRFFNLDYENLVIVSHESMSEIKLKSGQTITKVYPNIQDAVANKLAGMVDIVARVVVEDDGERNLNFKANEYIFGGGRLKGLTTTTIPLDWNELMSVYDATTNGKVLPDKTEKVDKTEKKGRGRTKKEDETIIEHKAITPPVVEDEDDVPIEPIAEIPEVEGFTPEEPPIEEKKVRKSRGTKPVDPIPTPEPTPTPAPAPVEDATPVEDPPRRTRKVRT